MRTSSLLLTLAVLLFPIQAVADDLSGLMPETVGNMKRIQLVTGEEAQAEVDKLHGKPLPAEASLVARYATPKAKIRPAEVWLSRVSSEKEARRQTGQMVHMMYENPRSPFKNPRRIDHGGNAVYRFEGMGQAHLVWFKDDLVWWISVDAENIPKMLEVFCN